MVFSALASAASQTISLKSDSTSNNGSVISAHQLFADTIFSTALASQTTENDLTLKAMERDIKRLQGLKTEITPADAEQLAKYEDEITRIEARAGPEGLSSDEIEDRAELYRAAYKILGKEFVDLEADDVLKGLNDEVDALLEPKLDGSKKTRLENLRKISLNLGEAYLAGNTSQTLLTQVANVEKQIESLTPPRLMSELSNSELREYDALVEKVNEQAGVEMILNSTKRARIEKIQSAMTQLGG